MEIYDGINFKAVLDSVRTAKVFSIEIEGKLYSVEAEKYLKWINQYSLYCDKEKREAWRKITREIIYGARVVGPQVKDDMKRYQLLESNNLEIEAAIYHFVNAGQVMKIYQETGSWEMVDDELKKQGHTGATFTSLINVLLQFSNFGAEFIERYCVDRNVKSSIGYQKII